MKIKLLILALFVGGLVYVAFTKIDRPQDSAQDTKTNQSFDFNKYSHDDPKSMWVVVNKKRPLNPASFVPQNLVIPNIALRSQGGTSMQLHAPAAHALERMDAAARKDQIRIRLFSGYRSYQQQIDTYNSEVKGYGKEQADKESARPGYSEHQTGLAADITAINGRCEIQACFANTTEGLWLAKNAYKYGFIISYPDGKERITGYTYEPWHIRYVGTELSTEMHNRGVQTLNEVFNLPPSPDY